MQITHLNVKLHSALQDNLPRKTEMWHLRIIQQVHMYSSCNSVALNNDLTFGKVARPFENLMEVIDAPQRMQIYTDVQTISRPSRPICGPPGAPMGFPGGSDSKESAFNEGDPGSIAGLGISRGEGNGNPLQYSCLENPMNREAWWATVHGVTQSRVGLSD